MPSWSSRLPNPPPVLDGVGRDVASKRYERASIATVVAARIAYCGRSENPFDFKPLNTDVASVVRHALALTLVRDDSRSETFATSSFAARANASLPPGACVTRNSSLLAGPVLTRPVAHPKPLPSWKRRSAISALKVLPKIEGTAAPTPTASRRRGDVPASAR